MPREPIDHRSARISEAKQFRHLVVRLSSRVVSRPSDQPVDARFGHEIQAGVAAGDNQHRRGQRQFAVRQRERLDVASEMMNRE